MSIDFSIYPATELDQALAPHSPHTHHHHQHPQHPLTQHHPQPQPQPLHATQYGSERYPPLHDHPHYDPYASSGPPSSSSFPHARYRSASAASPSLETQQHVQQQQQQQQQPQQQQQQQHQQQHPYPHDFLYASPVYSDALHATAPPSNPFDILSGMSHAQPPSLPSSNMQVHPYHRHGTAYAYSGALPTVAPNAVNTKQHEFFHQQSSYPDNLLSDRRPSVQSPDYSDEYGLASAIGANMVQPPALNQYSERTGSMHSENLYPSAPMSVPSQQPLKTEFRNGTPNGAFDLLRFASPPIQSDLGLGNMSVMSVDETLSKMKLQPSPAPPGADLVTFIRPYLEQYVSTPNRIGFGERSIIVMSSKVAQKSYGTEKRFLCPPPTAIMIGNSWWSDGQRGDDVKLVPPRVVISISGEPVPGDCAIDWTSASGKAFDSTEPPGRDTTYIGRCVGKQLFISEVDEKKKKVDALVQVTAPYGDEERVIGVFKSRPIKVISKPSKKRQSAKNLELCINHGSTISLFHRLRSQTVSTKYLCVSGSSVAFKGSDGASLPGVHASRGVTPSFVARTASWDPFVMYIVDVSKPAAPPDASPPPPPFPDYPSPPPNAIPFTNNGSQIPIFYNQTVVLQCLTSGVVSPVLIIRKVDRGTQVVGGGLQDGSKGVPDLYCAPGEVCGDPVSQLHKIAFEVFEPGKAPPDSHHPGISGSFLSCMGEKVNTYRPEEGRSWNSPANGSPASHSPSLPGSPVLSTPTSATSTSGGPEYFAHVTNGGVSPTDAEFPSSDGGRVKRPKRNSVSREGRTPTTQKGRRSRQNSTGSNRGVSTSDQTMSSGALWAVDVGETAIWTIVGTDQVRYNFYIPPALYDASSNVSGAGFPVPSKPVTPFPDVVKYLPPDRAAEAPKGHASASRAAMNNPNSHAAKMLTVYGANFSKTEPVSVFFGAEPSPLVEVRCTEVLACLPPENNVPAKRPIILVRGDGVVFPSNIVYP